MAGIFDERNPFYSTALQADENHPLFGYWVGRAAGLGGVPNKIVDPGGQGGDGMEGVITPEYMKFQTAMNAIMLERMKMAQQAAPATAAAPAQTLSQQRQVAEEKAVEGVKEQQAVATTRRTLRDAARSTQRNVSSAIALSPTSRSLF